MDRRYKKNEKVNKDEPNMEWQSIELRSRLLPVKLHLTKQTTIKSHR